MKIDGVWTGEIYTPYGWENSGVYILNGGDIVGGSNRHYSTGSYKKRGKKFKANLNVNYYGPPRVIFGDKQEKLDITVSGKIKKNVIIGEIVRPDKPQYIVRYRLTKRMDLAKNSK